MTNESKANDLKPDEVNLDQTKLDAAEISLQAAAIADHLHRSGVQWLPKPQPKVAESLKERFAVQADSSSASEVTPVEIESRSASEDTGQVKATEIIEPIQPRPAVGQSYAGESLPADQRQSSLQVINETVKVCHRCENLADCRTNTVFGEGSPTPRFVFFGEGPGADEDLSGRPFVGRGGQLLTKMIEACTLRREDVYILNTVKCRPPGNRNPEPGELENCREYYQRQLAILRPEYIVCLGAVSSQELLQNKTSVGKMRGRLHSYFESKVLVTYHPAYLLRTPAAKKAAWDDLQFMMRDAGLKAR
jgi:DNA polymerase